MIALMEPTMIQSDTPAERRYVNYVVALMEWRGVPLPDRDDPTPKVNGVDEEAAATTWIDHGVVRARPWWEQERQAMLDFFESLVEEQARRAKFVRAYLASRSEPQAETRPS